MKFIFAILFCLYVVPTMAQYNAESAWKCNSKNSWAIANSKSLKVAGDQVISVASKIKLGKNGLPKYEYSGLSEKGFNYTLVIDNVTYTHLSAMHDHYGPEIGTGILTWTDGSTSYQSKLDCQRL